MVEKLLHGINVTATCGQLVSGAVDIVSSGGVATATSAALSARALRPDARTTAKRDCLNALHTHLQTAGLRPETEKQIALMLDRFVPGKADFAKGRMTPATVAEHMRQRVLTETTVPEWRDPTVLDAYTALLAATRAQEQMPVLYRAL